MKYIYIIFLVILFSFNISIAQSWNAVALSDSVLNFGDVHTGQQNSRLLRVINNLDSEIKIENFSFASGLFSTNLDTVKIPALGQKDFFIYFKARHNINYIDFLSINVSNSSHPLIAHISAQAVYADSYYDSTQNKWGAELKAALHERIKDHTESSYANLWNILQDADEDTDSLNNVRLLYTGWSYPKSEHGGDNDQWNREHVWAKAHGDFGNTLPAGTDAHHICATDVSVNNARGSLDFDNGGSLYMDGDGATECRRDADSWEPRDAVKGDVARMMYYMVVRYEGEEGYDLELKEQIPSAPYNEPLFAKKSVLYQWHVQDSVDEWERRRNDRVYNWQHNRNPFIDHPEFAERMPSVSDIPVAENRPEISVFPPEIDLGAISPNDTAYYYFAIINAGRAELNVSQISCTNADFIPEQDALSVAAESYAYVKLTYLAPQEEGAYNTTMSVYSNDDDEGLVQIPVKVNVSSSVDIKPREKISRQFILYPNYPNPFNQETVIGYQVETRQCLVSTGSSVYVELTVYNTLGQKVQTIVNERQKPGIYKVSFYEKNLSSGVYFYKLNAGSFSEIRKMVLVR